MEEDCEFISLCLEQILDKVLRVPRGKTRDLTLEDMFGGDRVATGKRFKAQVLVPLLQEVLPIIQRKELAKSSEDVAWETWKSCITSARDWIAVDAKTLRSSQEAAFRTMLWASLSKFATAPGCPAAMLLPEVPRPERLSVAEAEAARCPYLAESESDEEAGYTSSASTGTVQDM